MYIGLHVKYTSFLSNFKETRIYSTIFPKYIHICGPGSSVGIAISYGREGAGFSAPVQTGPAAHPASCTLGTGTFLGVESGRGVTLTPHPFLGRGLKTE
jgi:hypothetical protein